MEELKSFKSRYGDERKVIKIHDDLYRISGKSRFTRYSMGEMFGNFCDMEGGPFIQEGMPARVVGIPDKRDIVKVSFVKMSEQNEKDDICCIEVVLGVKPNEARSPLVNNQPTGNSN